MESSSKIFARIGLLIFLYLLIYHFYVAIVIQPAPWEGDSLDYHIPIAQFFLSGTILSPLAEIPQQYYPGASEIILAALMFFGAPLNTYNILAWGILFFVCQKLAETVGMKKNFALLFALTVVTLNVFIRWLLAQTVDIWLAVYFATCLLLLVQPMRTAKHVALFGVASGMLIGTKYPGILFFSALLLFYGKNFFQNLTLKRFVVFFVPFFVFGLSWYMRNYLLTTNPIYPISLSPLFQGERLFTDNVFEILQKYPMDMINAFISEYRVWALAPLLGVGIIFSKKQDFFTKKLLVFGFFLLLFFPLFPTSHQPWIMVSSLRYTYPMVIPLLLGIFLAAQTRKKEELLSYVALGNMLLLHPLVYYPKLVFLYIPLAIFLFYKERIERFFTFTRKRFF